MTLQPRRAKTDWSGCCHTAVQGALWLAKRIYLNLNFCFLNRISLLISSSYPIVLTRLGGPRSRPCTSRKISRVELGIEPGTSWMAVRRANHYTNQGSFYFYILKIKLLYMSKNFYRKMLNVLLQNVMRMEHFEIYILKLIKKLISRKLIDQLNSNFVCSPFLKSWLCSIKIIRFWQLIWQFQNSTKLGPSVP